MSKQERKVEIIKDNLILSKSKKQILWEKNVGKEVGFKYDNTEIKIKIKEYVRTINRNYLIVVFNDVEYNIKPDNFASGRIMGVIGKFNLKYLYNVNDIVNGLLILEQIRITINGKNLKGYKYKCIIDGNIDTVTEADLERKGYGCNVCSNHKVLKGVNDISTTHPHLVKYFVNIEDTYRYSYGSDVKVLVKCPICENVRELGIDRFIKHGLACPKCSDGVSYPNKFCFNLLEQLLTFNTFETEYSPEWIGRKRYDFYFKLNNKEYIIEMDGGLGHGNKTHGKSKYTSEELKLIDDYKDEQAKLHNIEVIRIDCNYPNYESSFNYIKQNILNNEILNILFDFNMINWNKLFNDCLNSRIKEACDLWNSGIHSTTKIANIMKISSTTVCCYLKQGSKLKWTSYKPSHITNTRQIICITTNKKFNTIKEAGEYYNCQPSGIGYCCRGKYKHCGRLKDGTQLMWSYI